MISGHTLKATKRERLGTRYAKRERADGRLPAVLYGHGREAVAISLDAREALRYFHQGEKVFTIDLPGESSGQTVILKDLQFDYLGTNVVHVDLARVDLDEKITANVHVRLIGEAVGMKHAGAILTHPVTQIAVHCTVRTLPDHVEADITNLDVHQSLHARDVPLPPGITLASDPDAIIAAVSEVKEEVVAPEAAAVEGAPAEPEVITAKKEEAAEGGEVGEKGKAPAEKRSAPEKEKKEKK